uniref:Integrase catalytic domain-containing protein n=1 Tax=Nippostrongylus brasiliensis TaxID=27835 RepID=A0A0N4YFU7_NIPBR
LWGFEQISTPPYHPNSNGDAERFVQTFESLLYKGLRSNRIMRCGTFYLNKTTLTLHRATRKSPAEMLQGRNLRTTLDIIKIGQKEKPLSGYAANMKQVYDKGKRERYFRIGQEVYVRNYGNTRDRWISRIVVKKLWSEHL